MEAPLGPGRGLPIPPTPLVGRERGLAAACGALLDEGVRLLTLTGPPGVGKTRLALAAGAALAPAFPDGLWFVPLAAVADSTLVAGAVAAAVGVPDAGDRALPERLAEALGSRRALLVLDNFEQLMAAAPLVAALSAACPELRVLVTSRRPLRLLGERELRVPPLAVPRPPAPGGGVAPRPTDDPPTPAVVLFLQRARDARPDAVLTGQDAEAVAEVCRRLDGIPLALELAAARLRHLTAPALLALLAPALPLLTGGARDLPARQRTLHDAIAWSYGLLEPDERAFFRRLGVFVGGCSIEGAAAIAGDWPAPDAGGAASRPADAARPAARLAALEQLAALVDHGLVQPGPAGDARFGLLETVREYALERLVDSGELEAARRRHALHFLGLAERAAGAMHGTHQGAWLERLERERGNLRAALDWAIARGEAGPGARLVVALRWFWEIRGGATEGRRPLPGRGRRVGGRTGAARRRRHRRRGGVALHAALRPPGPSPGAPVTATQKEQIFYQSMARIFAARHCGPARRPRSGDPAALSCRPAGCRVAAHRRRAGRATEGAPRPRPPVGKVEVAVT